MKMEATYNSYKLMMSVCSFEYYSGSAAVCNIFNYQSLLKSSVKNTHSFPHHLFQVVQ